MPCISCHHYKYPKNAQPTCGSGEKGWKLCGKGNLIHKKTRTCRKLIDTKKHKVSSD